MLSELLAVAFITVLAVISPGPDFAMITRNSYAYGARSGLMSAFGIACGVQVHVIYTLFGIALLIVQSPLLFTLMKLAGAGYLVYLGWRSLRSHGALQVSEARGAAPSPFAAWRSGFLTNALNPKTMLFVVATYTQLVQPGSPLSHGLGYGLFISAAHWLWFSLVALLFSAPPVRHRLLAYQRHVDRLLGVALIGLGAALAMTGITT